mmetsp:Transcript_28915/g.43667  ORF Transcript_28915/g.43667 Transcript_28915/m.43667 type:complete len:401 (-) Transcript_28915:106-1308(-)
MMKYTGQFLKLVFLVLSAYMANAELRIGGGDQKWDVRQWYAQVDGVMGGKSSGYLEFEQSNSIMLFYGNINLDGGGFSSVRKQTFQRTDLTPFAGIVVELEAEDLAAAQRSKNSSPLGLHLQFRDNSRYGFSAAFAVPLSMEPGVETSVFLPLENFDRGDRNGFPCRNCALDATWVRGVDIYVLFQEGDFRVRIKSITAVDKDISFESPSVSFESVDDVNSLIDDTIYSSSYLYDYGYTELCISKYWSMISTLMEATSNVSDDLKGVMCAGLLHSTTQDTKELVAWSLRYTIDAVFADLNGENRTKTFSWLPAGESALTYADKCVGTTSLSSNPDSFVSTSNFTMPYDDLSPIPTGSMSELSVNPPSSGIWRFILFRYALPFFAIALLLVICACRGRKGP